VSDEIRRIQSQDLAIQEEWLRETDEPDIRDVDMCRVDEIGGWQVRISVLEYATRPHAGHRRDRRESPPFRAEWKSRLAELSGLPARAG
jgi:hypothetical protein